MCQVSGDPEHTEFVSKHIINHFLLFSHTNSGKGGGSGAQWKISLLFNPSLNIDKQVDLLKVVSLQTTD